MDLECAGNGGMKVKNREIMSKKVNEEIYKISSPLNFYTLCYSFTYLPFTHFEDQEVKE